MLLKRSRLRCYGRDPVLRLYPATEYGTYTAGSGPRPGHGRRPRAPRAARTKHEVEKRHIDHRSIVPAKRRSAITKLKRNRRRAPRPPSKPHCRTPHDRQIRSDRSAPAGLRPARNHRRVCETVATSTKHRGPLGLDRLDRHTGPTPSEEHRAEPRG
eukprot:7246588-Prymnesium_polylepis.1